MTNKGVGPNGRHPFLFEESSGDRLMIRALALLLCLGSLAGCGDSGNDSAIGGLTADEAAQLNEAASMLDVSNNPRAPANLSSP
jgi:hypothetical protein